MFPGVVARKAIQHPTAGFQWPYFVCVMLGLPLATLDGAKAVIPNRIIDQLKNLLAMIILL
jgi:hypothetical protein